MAELTMEGKSLMLSIFLSKETRRSIKVTYLFNEFSSSGQKTSSPFYFERCALIQIGNNLMLKITTGEEWKVIKKTGYRCFLISNEMLQRRGNSCIYRLNITV